MKKTPNKKDVLLKLVSNLQKGNVHVVRKGKSIIPESVDDLPPNMRVTNHIEYKKAYGSLWYNLNKSKDILPYGKKGRWSNIEEGQLLALKEEGKNTDEMVVILNRSKPTIKTKLRLMERKPTVSEAVKMYKEITQGKNITPNPARKGKEIVTFNFDTMSIHINGKTQTISVDFI